MMSPMTQGNSAVNDQGVRVLSRKSHPVQYLLETSLHQVLREQVPDQIKEGIQAGHVIVLLALAQPLLQFGVARVND